MRVSRCTHTSGPPHLLTLHAGTCTRPQRGHFHPYRVRPTAPCSSGRCLATEDDHAIASAYHRMSSTPAPPASTWNHTLPLRPRPKSCGTPGRPPRQYSTPLMPRESPSPAQGRRAHGRARYPGDSTGTHLSAAQSVHRSPPAHPPAWDAGIPSPPITGPRAVIHRGFVVSCLRRRYPTHNRVPA